MPCALNTRCVYVQVQNQFNQNGTVYGELKDKNKEVSGWISIQKTLNQVLYGCMYIFDSAALLILSEKLV